MDLENMKKLATVAGTGVAIFIGYRIFFSKKEVNGQESPSAHVETKKLDLPKVGDGKELGDYGKALISFGKRCEEYGKGAGYVDVYGTKTIFLTNPEMVRKVLGHSVQHSLWGGLTAASEAFFGKNVLFVLEGDKWRFLRGVMKHSLLHQNVKLMTEDVATIAHLFSSKISSGSSLDFNELMGLYHLAAIGKSAFNFDLDCLSDSHLGPTAISRSFEYFINELPRRALNPDQSVDGDYEIENEQNKKWKTAATTVRNTIIKVVESRLEELNLNPNSLQFERKEYITLKTCTKQKENRKDLLNSMIFANLEETLKEGNESKTESHKAEIQVTKHHMNQVIESITDNLVEILFAGYNTNVGTIANALHFLAENQEYQKRCREEVDTFFSKMPTYHFDAQLFSKIFADTKLLSIENLFLETLRLRPPAPMLARLLSKTFEFGEGNEKVILPKSYPLWIPAEFLHTNDANWHGHSASEFKPQRFELKKPYELGSYIPFSGGPRDCIGKNFAKLEAVVVITMLLRKYSFLPDPDYVFKNEFNGFGYRPVNEVTGKVSMKLIVKKRQLN